jgi:Ti-type conjugative transfer relaxase TraA
MPIKFLQVRPVSLGKGESAVGLGSYVTRSDWTNPLTGQTYDFLSEEKKQGKERRQTEARARSDEMLLPSPRRRRDAGKRSRKERKKHDVVGEPIVILPPGTPEQLRDPLALWVAAERAEVTVDRKTKLPRFKKKATVAKHVILALPKELSAVERRELAVAWAKKAYPGVAVMLVIHEADDPEIGNHHAHLLVSTRMVGATGFGKKARHLDPKFSSSRRGRLYVESQNLPRQWQDFQNQFFRRKSIPLVVDASISGGGVHWGAARFIPNSTRVAEDTAALKAARERIREPLNLLSDAVRHRATFSRRSLQWLLNGYGVVGDEAAGLIDRALANPETIPLFDPETGKRLDLYTTKTARSQEQDILDAAEKLLKRKATPKQLQKLMADMPGRVSAMTFSPEQKLAYEHLLLSGRLAIARGIAGAGKSHVIKGAVASFEAAGFRVVALAPTNTVVATMAAEGFAYANTLHSERYRMEHLRRGWTSWNANTVVIVDEAGMIDSGMKEWLVKKADETGARLILVGDEAQLTSVERGGMFAILKHRFGAAELKEVRRQQDHWAKQASLDLSEGRIADALAAYNERGRIHWSADPDRAMQALVLRWAKDQLADATTPRFVYVATNAVANALNNRLQKVRFGEREDFLTFDCDRGRIRVYPEDRAQFHATDKRLGILNGQAGKIVSMVPDKIIVETDAGTTISFDPTAFTGWGLGYCGTVYRGQGKTLPKTYALYDHVRAWSARSTYVALTRHRSEFDLFVPKTLARDLDQLGRQMSRGDGSEASLSYLTAEEAARKCPRVPILVLGEDGRQHQVDAAEAGAAGALATHWEQAKHKKFARDFNALERAARTADPLSPLHARRSEATTEAMRRGILPKTGYPDPRCLKDFIPTNDGLVRSNNPVLKPGKRALDVRPIVVDVEQLRLSSYDRLARRLEQLDQHVLTAILKRLNGIAERLKTTVTLFSDICVARHLVRFTQLLKVGSTAGNILGPGREDFDSVLALDPVRRETLGRFRMESDATGERATVAELEGTLASSWLARLVTEQQAARRSRAPAVAVAEDLKAVTGRSGPSLAPVLSAHELDERAALMAGVQTERSAPPSRPSPAMTPPERSKPAPAKINEPTPPTAPAQAEISATPIQPIKRRTEGPAI